MNKSPAFKSICDSYQVFNYYDSLFFFNTEAIKKIEKITNTPNSIFTRSFLLDLSIIRSIIIRTFYTQNTFLHEFLQNFFNFNFGKILQKLVYQELYKQLEKPKKKKFSSRFYSNNKNQQKEILYLTLPSPTYFRHI